jgi:regulator of RNase E activity RraB
MSSRTDIRNQLAGDHAVIQRLIQAGDDPRQPHVIDHHMLSSTELSLKELSRVAQLLAFQVTPVTRETTQDSKLEFSCYLKTMSTTALPFISRQSILMAALAEAFGCTYNGWGAQIVKSPSGNPEPAA